MERHQRVVDPALVEEERGQEHARRHEQENRARSRPTHDRGPGDRINEQGEAPADEHGSEGVVTPLGPLAPALGNDPRRQREHERPHGHVDEEDPAPAEVLRENAAGEDTDSRAATTECAPHPERLVPLGSFFEARHHDRERRRRDDRPTEALDGTGRDQHPLGLSHAADE